MAEVCSVLAPQRSLSGMVLTGAPLQGRLKWFAEGLAAALTANGHDLLAEGAASPRLIVNFTDARRPRPVRRRAQGTFVVSVVEVSERPADILKAAYPILIRSLSNLLIYIVSPSDHEWSSYVVTPEQGHYPLQPDGGSDGAYFNLVYQRLAPLMTSQLVVNNLFSPDLPPELWEGDEACGSLSRAGERLDRLNLLPAAFPIQELLPPRDMAHLHKLFGVGGLSYGNLSVRRDERSFWMSASGVDKGKMRSVGRDMLLIKGYDPVRRAMLVSVPPGVKPRRASVDAIEHWMIYTEHQSVSAIIHIHAWMEGVPSTTVNYPCGTAELATEVAELVRRQPDPACAVIGLKNHGLTVTGHSLEEIFERIEGRLLRQVPMS